MTTVTAPDRWTGHVLLLASAAEARADVAAWASAGLGRGEKVLYAADGAHPTSAALGRAVVDGVRAVESGQLVVVEPDRFFSVEGYGRLVDDALGEGWSGVRTISGPGSAAAVLEPAQFAAFEAELERTWADRAVTALCRYGPGEGDGLDEAIARHSSGWDDPGLRSRPGDPGRLRLDGEVDSANDQLLATVLARAVHQAGDELVVDCAGLEFVSVSGWRAAAAATGAVRRRGGRVRLTGLSELGAHVLRVTGYDDAFAVDPL